MAKLRTCTTMLMTDGTTSIYAAMRGPMKGKAFNSHRADIIARYRHTRALAPFDYAAATARHATADAPAVDWQRHGVPPC